MGLQWWEVGVAEVCDLHVEGSLTSVQVLQYSEH